MMMLLPVPDMTLPPTADIVCGQLAAAGAVSHSWCPSLSHLVRLHIAIHKADTL